MSKDSILCNSENRPLAVIRRTARRCNSLLIGVSIIGVLSVGNSHSAQAFKLYNGTADGNNLEINLTTTISYSGFYRVNDPSAILAGGGAGAANSNDGDSNFRHGIVGNQFEVIPVLDIRDGDFGAHFSGEAFLNTVYLQKNQNDQPTTFNSILNSSNRDFTSATRNVNGENAKLLDAFVFGQHEFADGQTIQLKVGRQTLFWGQSLLFANNGISAGQGPIDLITAQSTPNAEAQQVFLPVGQAVVTYRPNIGGLAFQAYYQFEWAPDSFQGTGAYFNGSDFLDKGAQSLILASDVPGLGNEYALRDKDNDPEHQNGQFGVSVQDTFGNFDLGVYALRFDSKAPEVEVFPGANVHPVPGGLNVAQYQLVYPRDIQLYGASFSTNIGPANVAGEVSGRRNMPLWTGGGVTATAANPGVNANGNPLYPTGNVVYAQASAIYLTPGVPLDPGGISIVGEVAMNHLVNVINSRENLVVGHQATAAAFNIIMTPTYYDVLPNLDVTIPIGIEYNFLGRSEVDYTMYHGTGTFNVGVSGTYFHVWIASLTYQDYLGKPDTTYNALADRGYLALNLQRTF